METGDSEAFLKRSLGQTPTLGRRVHQGHDVTFFCLEGALDFEFGGTPVFIESGEFVFANRDALPMDLLLACLTSAPMGPNRVNC